jgi:hypothetical protein
MKRPSWVDKLSSAYGQKRKNVIALTGNVRDLFFSPVREDFVPLEQLLYQELKEKFLLVKFDSATGISFFTDEDEKKLGQVFRTFDGIALAKDKVGSLEHFVNMSREQPLAALVALRNFSEVITKLRADKKSSVLPLCIVVQFAGAIFPAGEFDRLNELDRQRLVSLLRWIDDPFWSQGDNLLVLVNDTRAELNARIFAHPGTQQIVVDLPGDEARRHFVEARSAKVTFEPSRGAFISESAGLKLSQISDLITVAQTSNSPLARAQVLEEVNSVLMAELGDIIKVSVPSHSIDDIVGNEAVQKILKDIFEDCEKPETAVSGILVSGPNGGGKTFLLEALAAVSGRIVIELSGLRSSDFGGTEKLFEMLLSRIKVFGKILILIDEAHTAFGSVHNRDVHETEKRLAGNLIKMMGNPALLGKVLWGLMTSRPDELDPDVKSRCSEQIAIFDSEGEERHEVVKALFKRKKIEIPESDFAGIIEQTRNFSMRDFGFLVRKVLANKKSVSDVLRTWKASGSIVKQRRFQSLVAFQHCSYPEILPPSLKEAKEEDVAREMQELRFGLGL